MWDLAPDMWHLTSDKWHATGDMWHMVGGEHSLKISASQLLWFGIDSVLKILSKMNKFKKNTRVSDPLKNMLL